MDGAGQFSNGAVWHPDTLAHVVRYHYAQQFIERLAPGSQVLDLGCGELQLLRHLQMNRCQWPKDVWYWGYDVRAKYSWHKHLLNGPSVVNLVRQNAFAEWPSDFPTSYELVICYEMFEHVSTLHPVERACPSFTCRSCERQYNVITRDDDYIYHGIGSSRGPQHLIFRVMPILTCNYRCPYCITETKNNQLFGAPKSEHRIGHQSVTPVP